MDTLLYVFIHVLMLGSLIMVPRISGNDVEFGINVPPKAKSEPESRAIRKQFYAINCGLGGMIMGLQVVFGNNVNLFMVLLFGSLVLYTMVYLRSHRQVKALKAEKGWVATKKSMVIDTTFRKRRLTVSPVWYLGYVAIILVTAATALYHFDSLPDMVNVQANSTGGQATLMPKGRAMMYMVGLQVFMMALLTGVQLMIRKAKQNLNPNQVEASIQANVSFRYVLSIILYFLGIGVGITLYMSLLMTIGLMEDAGLVTAVILLLTFIPALVLIGASLKYGQDGSRLLDAESEDLVRDEDNLWKWGMFYVNANDPAIFVGKRVGVGWTLNFARWQSWAMLAGLVIFIIVMLVFV